jgi:hypothetical protein
MAADQDAVLGDLQILLDVFDAVFDREPIRSQRVLRRIRARAAMADHEFVRRQKLFSQAAPGFLRQKSHWQKRSSARAADKFDGMSSIHCLQFGISSVFLRVRKQMHRKQLCAPHSILDFWRAARLIYRIP